MDDLLRELEGDRERAVDRCLQASPLKVNWVRG